MRKKNFKKFSVIIPTLQMSPHLSNLLMFLESNIYVGEIILINNYSSKFTHNASKKIRIIDNACNNFVNPSWNQGIKLAKFENIVLSNDDIIIKYDPFPLLNNAIQVKNVGIIGCSFNLTSNKILKTGKNFIYPFRLSNFERRPVGFGCFMVFKKENYFEIPEEMKIYFGDDYLIYKNKQAGNYNFAMTLPYFESEMSLTSSEKKFNSYMETDEKIYQQAIPATC